MQASPPSPLPRSRNPEFQFILEGLVARIEKLTNPEMASLVAHHISNDSEIILSYVSMEDEELSYSLGLMLS